MERSPYLAQAIQAMGDAPAAPSGGVSFTPEQIKAVKAKIAAFKAANPDGNIVAHQLMQAGRNMAGVPNQLQAAVAGAVPGKHGAGQAPQAPIPPPR